MFERALKSIGPCAHMFEHFEHIVISINGKDGFEDVQLVDESGLDLNRINQVRQAFSNTLG